MKAIWSLIKNIVNYINATRNKAECYERIERINPNFIINLKAEQSRGKYNQVFKPLTWPTRLNETNDYVFLIDLMGKKTKSVLFMNKFITYVSNQLLV